MVQPTGLVASARALAAAGAFIDRAGLIALQQKFEALTERKRDEDPILPDLPAFCFQVLGWEPTDLAGALGGPELSNSFDVSLPEYPGDLLRPTYAVPDPDRTGEWLMLIKNEQPLTDLDSIAKGSESQWHASPQLRFERLLRETGVGIGLLFNAGEIRLVYVPRAESSGHLSFPVKAMCEVGGRPILGALHMLLCAQRLFIVEPERRLPAILRESRKFQNDVSTALAEQVLEALNLLLRGFQAAHEASGGELLREVLRQEPSHVYGGLLSVLLRLVFILYAEERGLLPSDGVFESNYSLTGLFEELREDAARYPDTMDQRFGAWARLLTLFRLIYDGASYGATKLPARHGGLFDPDSYPFLEGRPYRSRSVVGEPLNVPRVSDAVVYAVLDKLLILDGERLSYRTLDVEQIGSVYEAMMGFELRVATGVSAGLRPDHVVVNLETVLGKAPGERARLLKDEAKCEVAAGALDQLKAAKSIDELLTALDKRLSPRVKGTIPVGSMYLQPTEERRRTGSHYTPRSLTEPIVRTTLRPILEVLGDRPRPEQILDLKVCDPAMGSGAFLVEACRLLGDRLVESWQTHRCVPQIPSDEDLYLHARRIVAQTCLYGVDKNPFAVDLAKLSLWLATLARDHPFTFLDHAFRCGDSLVGLTTEQIKCFNWEVGVQIPTIRQALDEAATEAVALRLQIRALAGSDDTDEKSKLLKEAEEALYNVRLLGDLAIAAFFSADNKKEREQLRERYEAKVRGFVVASKEANATAAEQELRSCVVEALGGAKPIPPFHWEIEFPEVFARENSGFDAFVGNPPFVTGSRISGTLGHSYLDYLLQIHAESHGNGDLVAHFFRRSFDKVRLLGAMGLVATNTIAQGDTRATGLRWICKHGGVIFDVRKRLPWPGQAAVVVSTIHIRKGSIPSSSVYLDGRNVERITAFLFYRGGHDDPARLSGKNEHYFSGSKVNGDGFILSIEEAATWIQRRSTNAEVILPYIDGDELNSSPSLTPPRRIICFKEWPRERAAQWPELLEQLELTVKPQRATNARAHTRNFWWQFEHYREPLYSAIGHLSRVLVVASSSKSLAFAFLPTDIIYSHALIIIPMETYSSFCSVQSRPHECWARFFASSFKDDLRYTPSDCFETFPFSPNWDSDSTLEPIGKEYYEFRADMMIRKKEGLTKTYNRFHDPEERDADILKLREVHDAMDRAVLEAYGWTDLKPCCEFILDYEEEESEGEPSRKRKKPWRYRWPDDFRDEVLARLLALNQERTVQEKLMGATVGRGRTGQRGRTKSRDARTTTLLE